MLVIHKAGVHLRRGDKLLKNIDPDNPISSFWDYIESLMCCPVMKLLF